MFFDGWQDLYRILAIGLLSYVSLVFLLRVTGKRTLSKMNAFDFVVTVALGSSLASVLLTREISLSEGVFGLALPTLLQFAVAFASARSRRLQGLVKAQPTLLLRRGAFLDQALQRERVTREEVLAAIRAKGIADLLSVDAVVLETDGTFSVLSGARGERIETLVNVEGAEESGR